MYSPAYSPPLRPRFSAEGSAAAPHMTFPPGLFDGPLLESADCRRWWVLYTKARQEKAISNALTAREIPHFLPLYRKVTQRGSRRHEAFVPAFSSYLFAYCDNHERIGALETNRISRVIEVADHAQAELSHNLRSLKQAIDFGVLLSIESRIGPGQRVRVKSGPLLGTEGIVRERRSRSRLIVAVKYLSQGVSISIEDYLLEPI